MSFPCHRSQTNAENTLFYILAKEIELSFFDGECIFSNVLQQIILTINFKELVVIFALCSTEEKSNVSYDMYAPV